MIQDSAVGVKDIYLTHVVLLVWTELNFKALSTQKRISVIPQKFDIVLAFC